MKGTNQRSPMEVRNAQRGFTLVELLVVVGIIVALAAVIFPNVTKFADKGDTGAEAAEIQNVQAAFDTMMAEQNILTVDAQNTATDTRVNTWTAEPTGTGAAALSTYLRNNTTTYWYCWDAAGKVTQHTAAGNCA
jgi:prepilin-type N-terminal cleavage/methylation domain-containing protein